MQSIGKHGQIRSQEPRRDAPDKVVWPAPDATHGIGAPLAWGISLAAVATVFAIIAIVANFGPLNQASEEQRLKAELPASRYDAIGALITASGQSCAKVCSIKPEPSITGATRLDVTCAATSGARSCAAPVRYAIAVSREE